MAIGGVIYDLMPLSHLYPGMTVLVRGDDGALIPTIVDSVEHVSYSGPVYDLEVDRLHSYVANDVLVHNSIYRFRAADIRNILEFEQAFPDVTVITLEQNYRSTQTILDAANAVIANNLGRKPKNLWTDQGLGDPIVRYHADDEGDEAQWVAHQIALMHDDDHRRWGDVAVFYRTNAQSRVLEEHFMRVGIPYKVLGGTRFYDRREVKDAVAYLRAVANPADEVSVKRVVNVPEARCRRHDHGAGRRVGDEPRALVPRRVAPGRRGGRVGCRAEGHRRRSSSCSTTRGACSRRVQGRCSSTSSRSRAT